MIFFQCRENFRKSFIKVTSACVLTALKKRNTPSTALGTKSDRKKNLKRKTFLLESKAGTACSLRPCGILAEKNDSIRMNIMGWLK